MISNDQKTKLKKILASLSDEEELKSLKDLEEAEMTTNMEELASKIEVLGASSSREMQQIASSLNESLQKTKSSVSKLSEAFMEAHQESSQQLVEAISKMGDTITTSYEKNKPANAAGVYKDMINQLSSIDESIKNKPVPVWNWPQYASVGVRDSNFRNVNPAIAGFNITSPYDYISLSYSGSNITGVTYKTGGSSGSTVAVLALTYSGSNILTVTRTS